MKGVSYVTDGKNHTKAVLIQLKTIEEHQDSLEDFFDILIAESRRNEPKKSWEEVKKTLKKKGKL